MTMRAIFLHGGKIYSVSELKVREVEALEAILGERYVDFAPFANMRHKLAHMAMFLGRDHSPEEVEQIISEIDLKGIRDMWDIVDDDLPEVYENGIPLPEGGPSTPSS